MAQQTRNRVAVNGYGVIGRRGADAMAVQEDMEPASVADITADWRPRMAARKGYPLYAAAEDQAAPMRDAELYVVTMAAKVPETLVHLHYWTAQLTREASKAEVLDAFRASSRSALIEIGDGLSAINSVREMMAICALTGRERDAARSIAATNRSLGMGAVAEALGRG